jgi:hypothetical protein
MGLCWMHDKLKNLCKIQLEKLKEKDMFFGPRRIGSKNIKMQRLFPMDDLTNCCTSWKWSYVWTKEENPSGREFLW